MRFGLVAIAASMVAHVAIMELIGAVDPPPPRVRPTPTKVAIVDVPITIESIESIEPEPIGIDLVAPIDPAIAAVAPPAPSSPPRVAPRPATSAATEPGLATPAITTGVEAAIGPGTEATEATPGAPGIFTMRRAPRPNLDPRHVTEGMEVAGGAPPPPALEPSGQLQPSGGGTFRSEKPGFRADVKRDGTVTFTDKPAFSIGLQVPNPRDLARAAARGIETWYDDPSAAIRAADRNFDREPPRIAGTGEGSATKQEDLPPPVVSIPLLGGSAEITDWVMRRGGMDPYASAKRKYLDDTRDERAALRLERERELLARSVATIRKHLARVWKRTDLAPAARRQAIFELWDECVEDGDEEVVGAGNRARAAVIGFVRGHLPAGSPDAFTAAELVGFNRTRSSKQPFVPYE